jgi:hypothetical protein
MDTKAPVVAKAKKAFGGLDSEFWARRPLIGMVHLGPLPGSARYDPVELPLDAVLERARADARALVGAGADALLVENRGDIPFAKSAVPPHTIAAMTRAVFAVRTVAGEDVPVGVNVLRNDVLSAIAIAHVTGARFVRISVYIGAVVTDQGVIEGAAREAVLYRKELGADVAIWADVFTRHAAQLGEPSQMQLEDRARDAVYRGLADTLIVPGADAEAVAQAVRSVPGTPVLIGSGFDTASAATLLGAGAVGAIVGTSLKAGGGSVTAPVEASRVRGLREAMKRSAP